MPQIHIPHLGTIFILTKDWTFRLYFEYRNAKMLEVFGVKKCYSYYRDIDPDSFENSNGQIPDFVKWEKALTEGQLAESYKSYSATNSTDVPYIEVTFPQGTQLKVDRIYIRQGGESFASVTFRTTKICPDKRFANKRFWAKLRHVNEIHADII